jgi:hypothetical protein
MCDLGLPCGKLDCPFTPRNAVETRRIESPYGLNVKKLDLQATIATIPRDADENDASSNQNPHLEFSPGVGSHDCAMNSWKTRSAGNCAQVTQLGGPARP